MFFHLIIFHWVRPSESYTLFSNATTSSCTIECYFSIHIISNCSAWTRVGHILLLYTRISFHWAYIYFLTQLYFVVTLQYFPQGLLWIHCRPEVSSFLASSLMCHEDVLKHEALPHNSSICFPVSLFLWCEVVQMLSFLSEILHHADVWFNRSLSVVCLHMVVAMILLQWGYVLKSTNSRLHSECTVNRL